MASKKRRIIFSGEITEESAGTFIRELYAYNDLNSDPIDLVLSSGGGDVYSGFAMIGAIEESIAPIHVYCLGSVMSMALPIVCVCDVRAANQWTTFMYHEILGDGEFMKIVNHEYNIAELKRLQSNYDSIIHQLTKIPKRLTTKIKTRNQDYYFSAQEALNFQIIDSIL